jgi:hypothetical protein
MREFRSRDPSLPEFWDERFGAEFTPWDARGVPAGSCAGSKLRVCMRERVC